MKKAHIDTVGPKSFLQIKEEDSNVNESKFDYTDNMQKTELENPIAEKDDIDNEDEELVESERRAKAGSKPMIFTELDSKIKKSNQIIGPRKNPVDALLRENENKYDIIKKNQLKNLQRTHLWKPKKSEKSPHTEEVRFLPDHKHSDLFVSYLGFLRDKAYKDSPPKIQKMIKNFSN